MKKFSVFLLILALALTMVSVQGLAIERNAVQNGAHSMKASIPLGGSEQYLETADAALLYELNTDTLVYTYHADARINPTGMVKLLTALVALEQGNLDDMVTVSRKVLDSVAIGSVSAGLKRGEEISVRDLLYCIMVASANDAAAVLADYIGGTQEQFVAMMNAKAAELGCTNSNFTNAHGLTDANQYSTARDLGMIVEAALDNALFTEMFAALSYTVPATNKSEARELKTTNHMMTDASIKGYKDDRVTGGKPAAASTTDRSMICTAQVGTEHYLCIVMSAEAKVTADGLSVTSFDNFLETKSLLDWGFRNFDVRQVIETDQIVSQYSVQGGENDVLLHPENDLFTVLPADFDLSQLSYSDFVEADKLVAPLKEGETVGSIQVQYGKVILGSCNLLSMYEVKPADSVISDADRLDAPIPEKGDPWAILKWIGIGLAGLVLLAFVILLIIRLIRSARIARRHRRRMRQRRRSR